MSDGPVKVLFGKGRQLLELRLAQPKANILDAAMIQALDSALEEYTAEAGLKAVLLSAEGPHFSFGASVKEHLPEHCAAMLESFHKLVLRMFDYPVPILAAVHGQCLGGGLEIVSAAHLVFAGPDMKMGQPEIKLGVFAPAASCLLPIRIGQARAEDLLLSGRSIDAEEAYRVGLVTSIDDDPVDAAIAWFDEHLAPLSASSLRHATLAARGGVRAQLQQRLAEVESQYLDELMQTNDAVEGLNAFIAGRPPVWEHS